MGMKSEDRGRRTEDGKTEGRSQKRTVIKS